MKYNERIFYIVLFSFLLFVVVGFYFTFEKIAAVKSEVSNLELSLEILKKYVNGDNASGTAKAILPSPTPVDTSSQPNTNSGTSIDVPSAIVYEIKQNKDLKIPAETILNVDSAKLLSNELTFSLKAISLEATSSFSLSPKDFIQLVSLEGENIKASSVSDGFSNIQPKTNATGTITFKINASNTVILQIGNGDTARFFEFNFSTKTYKEVQLG